MLGHYNCVCVLMTIYGKILLIRIIIPYFSSMTTRPPLTSCSTKVCRAWAMAYTASTVGKVLQLATEITFTKEESFLKGGSEAFQRFWALFVHQYFLNFWVEKGGGRVD